MIALSVITVIYLALSSVQDLCDKEIYTFPADVLAVCWFITAALKMQSVWYFRALYIAAYAGAYFLFRKTKIWGAGDCDLFLVFAGVYLSVINPVFSLESLFMQVLLFAEILIIALIVSAIEAAFKRKRIKKDTSIAVAPGFFFVITGMLTEGVFLC